MYVPDNYDQYRTHEAEQERRLVELPVCDNCENPIQDDHYYEVNGGNICPECLETYFRKEN